MQTIKSEDVLVVPIHMTYRHSSPSQCTWMANTGTPVLILVIQGTLYSLSNALCLVCLRGLAGENFSSSTST